MKTYAEKMQSPYMSPYDGLQKIVEQLEFCNYTTKDTLHDLKDNIAFHALKELAKEQMDNYEPKHNWS